MYEATSVGNIIRLSRCSFVSLLVRGEGRRVDCEEVELECGVGNARGCSIVETSLECVEETRNAALYLSSR